jgi:hypothetical protein
MWGERAGPLKGRFEPGPELLLGWSSEDMPRHYGPARRRSGRRRHRHGWALANASETPVRRGTAVDRTESDRRKGIVHELGAGLGVRDVPGRFPG